LLILNSRRFGWLLISPDKTKNFKHKFKCCHCAFVFKQANPFRLPDSPVTRMAESGDGNRMEEARAQVGEVVDVMRVNVEKVLERDSKLSDLNSRADNLQAGANQFQTQVGF